MVATRDRAGRRVRQRLADPEDDVRSGALCYASRGFSLHAATHIEATDRRRPERLCRYVIRPPVVSDRGFICDVILQFSFLNNMLILLRKATSSPEEAGWM